MISKTILLDKIIQVVPDICDKAVFFMAVTETSYEVFFYSFIDGEPKQCYGMAEDGLLDENILHHVFASMVEVIRKSEEFQKEKLNVITISYGKLGYVLDVQYTPYERDVHIYKIKKEWMKKHIL